MSFHYVDRIYDYEPGKFIRGLKNVTRSENFFYWLPDGRRVLSPAAITEGLAQLGGWLKMVTTNFERRPVLLADERTDYGVPVEAGDQLDLFVEVLDFGDDVVVTRGRATVDGKDVVVGHCCRGYLLPLEDFSSPDQMRRAFQNLYKPEFKNVSRVGGKGIRLKPMAGRSSFESLRFVDGLLEHQPGRRVVGYKNFSSCEPYFATHFPNKPCVPGVLLLTFVGEVCQYLLKETIEAPLRSKALVPTFIQNVRFRKFVEPGDQAILKADVIEGDLSKDGSDVLVRAQIYANDNRVMQAEMGFRTMFAEAHAQKLAARYDEEVSEPAIAQISVPRELEVS